MFPIGNERVGIVTATAGTATTELFEAEQTGETVVWVDGCSFQIQTPAEAQNVETTTVFEVAHCFMPVTDDTRSIASTKKLRFPYPDGNDYLMRGDAVLEIDIRGRKNHVFARCERQVG